MGLIWRQFWALTWKNYIINRRKPITTCLLVFMPTLFPLIIVFYLKSGLMITAKDVESWLPEKLDLCFKHGNRMSLHCTSRMRRLTVYYSPDVQVTRDIMAYINKGLQHKLGFPNEDKLITEYQNVCTDLVCDVIGGVVFTNLKSDGFTLPPKIKYKIRMQSDGEISRTYCWIPFMKYPDPRLYERGDYFDHGFLFLQHRIDMGIIDQQKPSVNTSRFKVNMHRFPHPPYEVVYDPGRILQTTYVRFTILTFMLYICLITKDVTYEKEMKMNIFLKLVGVKTWVQRLTWLIDYAIALIVTVSVTTAISCVPVTLKYAEEYDLHTIASRPILDNADPSLIFSLMYAYVFSSLSFGILVSCFFRNAATATCVATVVCVGLVAHTIIAQDEYPSGFFMELTSYMNFQFAWVYAVRLIYVFQDTGATLEWSAIHHHVTVQEKFTMLHLIIMFFVNSFLYFIIAIYIDAVFPGKCGIPQPWYYPFCLCKSSDIRRDEYHDVERETGEEGIFSEIPEEDLHVGIRIINLRKVFGYEETSAAVLDGVNLTVYEGQITVLLGRNGTGKSVLTEILTGYYPPTSGTIIIGGLDIRKGMTGINSTIGFCPQTDALFDGLTVEEHLILFAKLRGLLPNAVEMDSESLMAEVNLTEVRHDQVSTLSGGMKRRLAILLAFIGDTKVIILDNPTRRLDVDSRRDVWNLIRNHRNGRTILLSTQDMDEAEYVGDRVAFLVNGKICCCGTPTHLKTVQGLHYNLVVKTLPSCEKSNVTLCLLNHMSGVKLKNNEGFRLSYTLQSDNVDTYPQLLEDLEQNRDQLQIGSYYLSTTTLDDIFTSVTMLDGDSRSACSNCLTENVVSLSTHKLLHGCRRLAQQYYALLVKRILYNWRCPVVLYIQAFTPFVTMMIIFVMLRPRADYVSPAISLNNVERYCKYRTKTVIAYSAGKRPDNVSVALAACYGKQFNSPLVKTINVGALPKHKTNPVVQNFLLEVMKPNSYKYTYGYMVAAQFDHDTKSKEVHAVAMYNYEVYHTPAISLSLVDNALLKHFVGAEYSIETQNNNLVPVYSTAIAEKKRMRNEIKAKYTVIYYNVETYLAFLVPSFLLVTNFFLIYLVDERERGSKHLQLMSGVHPTTFWLAIFVVDLLVLGLSTGGTILAFSITDSQSMVCRSCIFYILVIFLLFGCAILPITYIATLCVSKGGIGVCVLPIFTLTTGSLLNFVKTGLNLNLDDFFMRLCLFLSPGFAFTQAIELFSYNYWVQKKCADPVQVAKCAAQEIDPCCPETCHMSDECLRFTAHIFSKKGIGENLLGLAVHGAVAMTFLVLFDNGVFHTLWHQLMCRGLRADVRRCQLDVADDIEENLDYKLVGPPPHDPLGVTGGTIRILEEQPTGPSCRDELDVTDDCTVTGDSDEILERQLFASSSMTMEGQGQNAVVLFRLSKRYSCPCIPYRRRYAVKDLTFCVKGGECFGLLGVNGAGKRTTFEILAGKRGVSSGSASMTGHDVTTYGMETMKHIGYCGQPNAALDYMTCRETIWLYARLRGFAPENIEGEVDRLVGYFMMEKDITKRAGQLSEGSTQKLNMAMTLTGNPTVLVLEEPTASVDPVARRNAWVCLNDCRKRGQTVVLSTHCMTEAETLCTRVGILQRGRLKFIGSTLCLKSLLARSHFLNIQVDKMLPTKEEELIRFVESTFPECILSDRNDRHMSFKMMQVNWSKLFSFIKDLKSSYPIVGYSVGDANLDELLTRTTR